MFENASWTNGLKLVFSVVLCAPSAAQPDLLPVGEAAGLRSRFGVL